MTRIAFRVDASVHMGTGHLFRCLTLADALKKASVQTCFLCRELEGFNPNLILSRGHQLHTITPTKKEVPLSNVTTHNLPHSHWLSCSQQQDYIDCAEFFEAISPLSWIVVDHYALDELWEELARKHSSSLMVIDDLADRNHNCDILLDQNFYSDMDIRYKNLIPNFCKPLLGPRYSLLRPEFVEERQKRNHQRSRINRIFLFFGGSDITNETQKALDAINLLKRPDISIDVVIGGSNPHSKSILQKTVEMKQVTTYNYLNNMAEKLSQADLAIGAGGTSNWERFCLGVPSLVIGVAQNQIDSCEYLAKNNLIIYLGHHSSVSAKKIHDMIVHVDRNPHILKRISDNSKEMVNGLGVTEVLKELC